MLGMRVQTQNKELWQLYEELMKTFDNGSERMKPLGWEWTVQGPTRRACWPILSQREEDLPPGWVKDSITQQPSTTALFSRSVRTGVDRHTAWRWKPFLRPVFTRNKRVNNTDMSRNSCAVNPGREGDPKQVYDEDCVVLVFSPTASDDSADARLGLSNLHPGIRRWREAVKKHRVVPKVGHKPQSNLFWGLFVLNEPGCDALNTSNKWFLHGTFQIA